MSSVSSISSLPEEEKTQTRTRRYIPDRINIFDELDGEEFRQRYRFTKPAVKRLLQMIGSIEPVTQRNKSIDGMSQLLICLRFYADGSLKQLTTDLSNIHKSTICRIVQRVTYVIARLGRKYINMPSTQPELQTTAEQFYNLAGFPHVVGVVDCMFVKIISTSCRLAEHFRCRKGYYAINVQLVCDASTRIRDIIARWPGSVHDSTVFDKSHLCADFENGRYAPFYLLADYGYDCKRYLLTPLLQPRTQSEASYNHSHAITTNPMERCIGALKSRFPCLDKGITLRKTSTTLEVIVATAVLHNMCLSLEAEPPHDSVRETENDFNIVAHQTEDASVRFAIVNTVFL